MLDKGIAREVARTVLPVGLDQHVCNYERSLLLTNFLSLRYHPGEGNAFPQFLPQEGIEMVAEQMEEVLCWRRCLLLMLSFGNKTGKEWS